MSLPAWLTGLKGLVPDFIGHAEDRLKKSVQKRLEEFDKNSENGLGRHRTVKRLLPVLRSI